MNESIFTNVYTIKEGRYKDSNQYVVILENIMSGSKLILSPNEAIWIGKKLIEQAKKTNKKNK